MVKRNRTGRVRTFCTISGTLRFAHAYKPVISACKSKGGRDCDYDKRKMSVLTWHRYSITINQVMIATIKRSKWWLRLLDRLWFSCSNFLLNENLIVTASLGIPSQQRNIYFICRFCWNVAIYKWVVHTVKI
jgi:hypothetical protein